MPPKTAASATHGTSATQRATKDDAADAVKDQWSANPFKSTDPRHEQYEMQQRIAQREAAVSRVGHAIAKDMRTHDFVIGGVSMGRATTAEEYAARQEAAASTTIGAAAAASAATGSTTGSAAAPHSTADLTAVPSRLEAPVSYVEEALPMPGLTCSAVLQGGSLVLVGTREGAIIALNGFTKAVVAKVYVTEPISMSDRELDEKARSEGRDDTKRPARKARRGDGEAHSTALTAKIAAEAARKEKEAAEGAVKDTTPKKKERPAADAGDEEKSSEKSNEGAYPIAVSPLGESSFVAFVLSNHKVRVYDAMTLVAADEINFETEEEMKTKKQREEANKNTTDTNAKNNTNSNTNTTKKDSEIDDGDIPFAAVLPVDCVSDPILFFVVCKDRIVSINLLQPETLSDRPRLSVTRIKTYEKLGLSFVSAATDNARTVVLVGDDNGDVWTVDVSDLMVVDSWPAVPPPPPPPNTKKEQRKGAVTPRLASPRRGSKEMRELATAVGAFGEFIFAGTSGGRVVVSQKQPYGEKPLPILDEEHAHGSSVIIGAAADERAMSVWFASEDGVVTCWSLESKELTYKTRVPVGGSLVTAFALLPHAITNKVWTVTISGINKVWVTEDHQTHDEMGVAHTHMEGVVNRQELAMQQKEDEVEAAENLMLNRLAKIIDAMAEQNRQRILRAYYYAWVTARLKAITKRKREDAAEALNNSAVYQLARSYYIRLVANMTAQRARKQNEATINHLRTQREDELRSRYLNALRKYVLERRIVAHRDVVATSVGAINNASSIIPFFMDRWRRFAEVRRKAHQQEQYLALIGRVEGRRIVHHYYLRWLKRAKGRRLFLEQQRSVAILGDAVNNRLVRTFYLKWTASSAARKVKAQRTMWVEFINGCHDRNLLQAAFTTLFRNRARAARLREEGLVAEATTRKATLETSFAAVAPIVERKDRIEALRSKLDALRKQKDALVRDEAAVSGHNGDLRKQIAAVPNPILSMLTSSSPDGTVATASVTRVGLLSLMGRLRNLLINSEHDAATVNRVLGRAKAESVLVAFNAYVADLKATILVPPMAVPTAAAAVDVPGEATTPATAADPNAQWPQGESSVMRIVASADAMHMQGPLLQTIKGIVIAFDALSFSEVESIGVEGAIGSELVANGESLVLLGELLQVALNKKKADSPLPSPVKAAGTRR